MFSAFDIRIWQWSYQLNYPGLLNMSLCLFQIPSDIFFPFFIKMWVSFCGSYSQKKIELCHCLTSFSRYTLCILAESFMFTRGTDNKHTRHFLALNGELFLKISHNTITKEWDTVNYIFCSFFSSKGFGLPREIHTSFINIYKWSSMLGTVHCSVKIPDKNKKKKKVSCWV